MCSVKIINIQFLNVYSFPDDAISNIAKYWNINLFYFYAYPIQQNKIKSILLKKEFFVTRIETSRLKKKNLMAKNVLPYRKMFIN